MTVTASHRDNLILEGISEADRLKYHHKYVSHGTISGDKQGFKQTILVSDADNQRLPILTKNRWPNGGTFLLTTLDPDHHSCSGVPGPTPQDTEETRENARKLRDSIVEWTRREWDELPVVRIIWRKLRLLVYSLIGKILTLGLYSSAVILVVYWIVVKHGSGEQWYLVAIGGLGVLKLLRDWIEWVLALLKFRPKL